MGNSILQVKHAISDLLTGNKLQHNCAIMYITVNVINTFVHVFLWIQQNPTVTNAKMTIKGRYFYILF